MKFKSTFEGIFFWMLIDVEINGKNHLAIFIQQELRLQGGCLDNKHYIREGKNKLCRHTDRPVSNTRIFNFLPTVRELFWPASSVWLFKNSIL